MKRLNEPNKADNSKEHYNKIWKPRFVAGGLDISQPERAKEMTKKFTGGRYVEVGCGIAPHCLIASEKGESWGIDISDDLVALLRERYPQINSIVGDINDLPIKDNYFDCVALGEVIEHVEDPESVLKELFRILKPGGWLSLSTPLRDNGHLAPIEHVWSYEEMDIKGLLEKFGRTTEVYILNEDNHNYIIGHSQK